MNGLTNIYSLVLMLITSIILLFSTAWLLLVPFIWNMLGLPPFIFGCLMAMMGLQHPKSDPNRKIWLLTFFGKPTDVVVESLTFICNWIPGLDVLGYVEVDMKKVDHDFKLEKPILCRKPKVGGNSGEFVDDGYVEGHYSSTMVPDDSSAETLWKYQNAGGMDGIIKIIGDMLTSWTGELGKTKSNLWMETESREISETILPKIEGLVGGNNGNNPEFDDTRGLGIKFYKFNPVFKPTDKVIDARNDKLVEEAQRVSYMADTEATNAQIISRLKISHQGVTENGVKVIAKDTKVLTVAQAQDQIAMEKAQKDKDYKRVDNRSGLNVIDVTQR